MHYTLQYTHMVCIYKPTYAYYFVHHIFYSLTKYHANTMLHKYTSNLGYQTDHNKVLLEHCWSRTDQVLEEKKPYFTHEQLTGDLYVTVT